MIIINTRQCKLHKGRSARINVAVVDWRVTVVAVLSKV